MHLKPGVDVCTKNLPTVYLFILRYSYTIDALLSQHESNLLFVIVSVTFATSKWLFIHPCQKHNFWAWAGKYTTKYLNHSFVLSYSCKRKSLIDSPRPSMSHIDEYLATLWPTWHTAGNRLVHATELRTQEICWFMFFYFLLYPTQYLARHWEGWMPKSVMVCSA